MSDKLNLITMDIFDTDGMIGQDPYDWIDKYKSRLAKRDAEIVRRIEEANNGEFSWTDTGSDMLDKLVDEIKGNE